MRLCRHSLRLLRLSTTSTSNPDRLINTYSHVGCSSRTVYNGTSGLALAGLREERLCSSDGDSVIHQQRRYQKRRSYIEEEWRQSFSLQELGREYEPNPRDEPGVPDHAKLKEADAYPEVLRPFLPPKDILRQTDYFNMSSAFTLEDLFRHRVHLGHKVGTLDAHMQQFVYGERLGICIFDLEKTMAHMIKALNFLAHIAYRDGIILFVTADKLTMRAVERAAADAGEYAHCRKWKAGTLLDARRRFKTEIRPPDCVLMTNTLTGVLQQHPIIHEVSKLLIPIIGICDSNSNPSMITYPIPANDDTPSTIAFYLSLFTEAIRRGKEARKAKDALGRRDDLFSSKKQDRLKLKSLIESSKDDQHDRPPSSAPRRPFLPPTAEASQRGTRETPPERFRRGAASPAGADRSRRVEIRRKARSGIQDSGFKL